MKRRFVRGLARCLAGVLFLAQMTVAAYACPGLSFTIAAGVPMGQMHAMTQTPEPAAPQAEVSSDAAADAAAAADGMAAQMPDCSGMAAAMDPNAANLCAEHCKYGQQSDHASTLTVPAVILNALYTTPVVPPAPLPRSAAALAGAPVAAFPPHAILHCVFRI
jgi:hypothetical protein